MLPRRWHDVGMEELIGDERQRTAASRPRAPMSPINAAGVRLNVSIMRSSPAAVAPIS